MALSARSRNKNKYTYLFIIVICYQSFSIFAEVAASTRLAFSFIVFGLLDGNGHTVVIREGTLILAILTGICMRFTDPLIDRIFSRK